MPADADDVPPARREVEWSSFPETFDIVYVRKMKVADRIQVERNGDDRLTERQMESFRTASKAFWPKGTSIVGPWGKTGLKVSDMYPKFNFKPPMSTPTLEALGRQYKLPASTTANLPGFQFRVPQSTTTGLLRAATEQARATKQLADAVKAIPPLVSTVETPRPRLAVDEISQALAAKKDEEDRKDAVEAQRSFATIELLAATSASTSALVSNAELQERRITSQGFLTTVLSLAVVYDVANGTFDDHTVWTTLISSAISLSLVTAAIIIGKMDAKRRHPDGPAGE